MKFYTAMIWCNWLRKNNPYMCRNMLVTHLNIYHAGIIEFGKVILTSKVRNRILWRRCYKMILMIQIASLTLKGCVDVLSLLGNPLELPARSQLQLDQIEYGYDDSGVTEVVLWFGSLLHDVCEVFEWLEWMELLCFEKFDFSLTCTLKFGEKWDFGENKYWSCFGVILNEVRTSIYRPKSESNVDSLRFLCNWLKR